MRSAMMWIFTVLQTCVYAYWRLMKWSMEEIEFACYYTFAKKKKKLTFSDGSGFTDSHATHSLFLPTELLCWVPVFVTSVVNVDHLLLFKTDGQYRIETGNCLCDHSFVKIYCQSCMKCAKKKMFLFTAPLAVTQNLQEHDLHS